MIIKSVRIKKFRGFEDVEFKLGVFLTVIAGQNGTQKTTLLGILSQPFTITDKNNPIISEKPLCGGNFRSSFADKFKLSPTFDTRGKHEWTLVLRGKPDQEFTVESISRDDKDKSDIRFWQKGDKTKGSGYIQIPVIYLSLSRLFPIGEDHYLNLNNNITLTEDESRFYKEWHNKILIIPDEPIQTVNYLESKQKNTIGVNTASYDWVMNSAGQDNLGKILLAVLSFKRLKEKYPDNYNGGLLVIDELETTLYPASQIKLIEALFGFAEEYKIQIIFTTHSLEILRLSCEFQEDPKKKEQVKVVYLKKIDSKVKVLQQPVSFETIKYNLNVAVSPKQKIKKIPLYTEDEEARIFFKCISKSVASNFKCIDVNLGSGNLIDLCHREVPSFIFPNSLILLDGDVINEDPKMRQINRLNSKNILILPGGNSPERLLAIFFNQLGDESHVWNEFRDDCSYNKQVMFSKITLNEINSDRENAKDWFKSQKQYWGRGCALAINPWINANEKIVNTFIKDLNKILNEFK